MSTANILTDSGESPGQQPPIPETPATTAAPVAMGAAAFREKLSQELTKTEKAVFEMFVDRGLTPPQMAAELKMTETSVKTYGAQILNRAEKVLGRKFKNRLELVEFAHPLGAFPTDEVRQQAWYQILSVSEQNVLGLLIREGLPTKEIVSRLQIPKNTVADSCEAIKDVFDRRYTLGLKPTHYEMNLAIAMRAALRNAPNAPGICRVIKPEQAQPAKPKPAAPNARPVQTSAPTPPARVPMPIPAPLPPPEFPAEVFRVPVIISHEHWRVIAAAFVRYMADGEIKTLKYLADKMTTERARITKKPEDEIRATAIHTDSLLLAKTWRRAAENDTSLAAMVMQNALRHMIHICELSEYGGNGRPAFQLLRDPHANPPAQPARPGPRSTPQSWPEPSPERW